MKPRREKRPTHLGHYELIREIGRGGMGVIFEGRDPRHDRAVAIKVLPKQGDEEGERVGRFKREVQTIAMLSHEGIVRIYDVGEDAGRYYFVMEFIQGQSIKDAVQDGGMALRRGLEVIEAMCHAIAHAHRKGVIHRDINPNNILLDGDGRPVLIDFGIAKLADTSRLTRAGATIGTPRYLSPEQALGEPDVDERTDVYGLGATLYLIATGRPPFHDQGGKTVSLTALEEGPTAPRSVNSRVPREVELIIQTAMARRRSDRYRSPAEMATDIRAYLQTGSLRIARPKGSSKAVLWITAAVVMLLTGAGLLAAFGGGKSERRSTPPRNGAGNGTSTGKSKGKSTSTSKGKGTDGGTAQVSPEARRLLQEADALRQDGKHAQAVRAYFEALREGASKGAVLLGRAESNAALGKFKLALEDLAVVRTIERYRADAEKLEQELLPKAAPRLLQGDDLPAALDLLDRWFAADPAAASAVDWPARQLAAAVLADPDLQDRAAEHPEGIATAHAAGFHALLARHDGAEAKRFFERVTTAAPKFAEAWRALAMVRSRRDEHGPAQQALQQALALRPDLPNLPFEAFLIQRQAGNRAETTRLEGVVMGLLTKAAGGDAAAATTEFWRGVVATYEFWGDWIAAGYSCERIYAAQDPGSPVYAEYQRKASEFLKRWDGLGPSQLANDNDRKYREGLNLALGRNATRQRMERAVELLTDAVASDPHRLMSATYFRCRARAHFQLGKFKAFRDDVDRGLARNPNHPSHREWKGWALLADGKCAEALPIVAGLVKPDNERRMAFTPFKLWRRMARAGQDDSAGLQDWLQRMDEAKKLGADKIATYMKERVAELKMIRGLADQPSAVVDAYLASVQGFLGDRAAAAASVASALSALERAAPAERARLAHGLGLLAEGLAGGAPADPAADRAMVMGFFRQAAAWDVDGQPAPVRQAAWMAVARAAAAGKLGGRALDAAERAEATGAGGEAVAGLKAAAVAQLESGAGSAYELYRLGKLKQAAGDKFGARDAYQRALVRESDGSLLPGERSRIAEAIRSLR